MLYVDPPFDPRPYARHAPFSRARRAAHLSAETIWELRAYLVAKQFPMSYLHRPESCDFHYDLHGPYLAAALADPEVRKITRRAYADRLATKWLLDRRARG